jgi:hypothetical protein
MVRYLSIRFTSSPVNNQRIDDNLQRTRVIEGLYVLVARSAGRSFPLSSFVLNPSTVSASS